MKQKLYELAAYVPVLTCQPEACITHKYNKFCIISDIFLSQLRTKSLLQPGSLLMPSDV